jgi:hypothetical protein
VKAVKENRVCSVPAPVSSAPAAGTPMAVKDAPVARNNRQENLLPSATLRRSAVEAGRNLHFTVQRQICPYFEQSMNSF